MAQITTNVNTKTNNTTFKNRRVVTTNTSRVNQKTGEIESISQQTTYTSNKSASDIYGGIGKILSVLIVLLLLINFYKIMYVGSNAFNFTGTEMLLQTLANSPQLDVSKLAALASWSLDVPVIGAIVNFLKDIVMVIAYLGSGLVQIVLYISYFVGEFMI